MLEERFALPVGAGGWPLYRCEHCTTQEVEAHTIWESLAKDTGPVASTPSVGDAAAPLEPQARHSRISLQIDDAELEDLFVRDARVIGAGKKGGPAKLGGPSVRTR